MLVRYSISVQAFIYHRNNRTLKRPLVHLSLVICTMYLLKNSTVSTIFRNLQNVPTVRLKTKERRTIAKGILRHEYIGTSWYVPNLTFFCFLFYLVPRLLQAATRLRVQRKYTGLDSSRLVASRRFIYLVKQYLYTYVRYKFYEA